MLSTDTQPKVKDIVFNFTGFGPFLNITSNPTMELTESLKEWKEDPTLGQNIGDVRWLEVSAEDVRTYIAEIKDKILEAHQKNPEIKQVLVHFGVYAGSTSIHLEKHGYNCADFRGPDNKGYQPWKEKILKKYPLEHYFRTTFPVEDICNKLKDKHTVEISDDPGRYVCNYIFYSSMCEGYKHDIPSIFIHVPQFNVISKEKMEDFVKDFIKVARELFLEEFAHEE